MVERRVAKLLAVDPGLSTCGWALFSLDTALPLRVGTLSPPDRRELMPTRLKFLQRGAGVILEKTGLGQGDFLVCEGAAHVALNPRTSLLLEQVRTLFETLARGCGAAVPGRVNPRSVQHQLLGARGKQLRRDCVKALGKRAALQLYGELLSSLEYTRISCSKSRTGRVEQDIFDALLVGTVAAVKIKQCFSSGLDVDVAFSSNSKKKLLRLSALMCGGGC